MANDTIIRKRNGNSSRPKQKVTFLQGLKLWANQWRWSSIKKTWNEEHYRVTNNYHSNMDMVKRKTGWDK